MSVKSYPLLACAVLCAALLSLAATEAPTGLGKHSNGFADQATFEEARDAFEEVETPEKGLGPIHNGSSCRECHLTPITGGSSQITEFRAGHLKGDGTFEAPTVTLGDGSTISDRSLINERSICPQALEHIADTETIQARRLSLSILGDGFIEAIPDAQIQANATAQCAKRHDGGVCGVAFSVPVVEAAGVMAVGRFGWKAQHASLLSFSGDAYLNEMGFTSRLFPDEVTTLCNVAATAPNDPGKPADVDKFALFMRALKAPSRDLDKANSALGQQGEQLFNKLGCVTCHVATYTTAPVGTPLHGGAYTVAPALGDKIIHPYSDFLLHDVGTGDGIEVAAGEHFSRRFRGRDTIGLANLLRTPPLWGLRLRNHLMHDGASLTFSDAIARHGNEGARAAKAFGALSDSEQAALYAFLQSL